MTRLRGSLGKEAVPLGVWDTCWPLPAPSAALPGPGGRGWGAGCKDCSCLQEQLVCLLLSSRKSHKDSTFSVEGLENVDTTWSNHLRASFLYVAVYCSSLFSMHINIYVHLYVFRFINLGSAAPAASADARTCSSPFPIPVRPRPALVTARSCDSVSSASSQ